MIFKMSREQALQLNLLMCKHCHLPENNHFQFGKRTCAHDESCPGYEEVARYGTLEKK